MPKARAIKPKPSPPEHRYQLKARTKSGGIRTRYLYCTSIEDAREQGMRGIDIAAIVSCEQADIDLTISAEERRESKQIAAAAAKTETRHVSA